MLKLKQQKIYVIDLIIKKLNNMKVFVSEIMDQLYVLPTLKVTYKRSLNGDLELILGWIKYELIISI